jgi:type IV secretory pathway TraG/TraD family ATPase VirD4
MDTKRETLASIMSELSNHIIPLVTDRDIMNVLGKKDVIKPDLLEQGDDIFLQIPEYKINQWKVLITLIIQQFLTHFERRQEGDNVPILFLLDEFARFGKLEAVIHGLATLRSKRITICILIQSLAQLDATYGPEQRKIICDNCGYKAVLSATDVDTQKYFSALVGTKMYTQQQFSETAGESKDNKSFISFVLDTLTGEHPSGSGSASVSNSQSISTSEVERAVIKPEDFAYLKNDMVLLTPEGYSRVVKCPYYAVQPFR